MRLPIPAFWPDSRANRIKKHFVVRIQGDTSARRRLYICGPEEAMVQIRLASVGNFVEFKLSDNRLAEFTHALEYSHGIPANVLTLVEQLESLLTLKSTKHLDFAVTLDWYKIPSDDQPADQWPNTPTAELVRRGKYYQLDSQNLQASQTLALELTDVINAHPLLANAPILATVPGHKADGKSFGETVAKLVAKKTGKKLVLTESIGGPRPQAKEESGRELENAFKFPAPVTGEAIILDDVYRTGTSLRAAALAARQAGAHRVYGLTAVRTMRR